MTVKSYKLGPGTLTLGPGSPAAIESQVTGCKVTWAESVAAGDVVPVLSGEELQDDDVVTYAATLSGNVVQDGDAAGLVWWTWEHKGETVPFTFVPSTDLGTEASGTVRIVPLDFGGDEAKKRPRSDFSWACPDDPSLAEA